MHDYTPKIARQTMSHRKLNSFILTAACILALASCKKDEDSGVSLPSLNGTLRFELPKYILQNATVKMTPSGVTHPEGEELGYYWKVQTSKPAPDTTRYENGLDKKGNPSDGSFTYTFPDTLKTYSVGGYAYAQGYTYTSTSMSTTIVKGGLNGSITGLGLNPSQTMTEEINGRKYTYVTVGETDWMCRNISDPSAGAPYANCKAMDDVFGRYYSYEEALTICPEGWELPSDADWTALAKAAGATETENQHSDFKGIAAALMANAYFNEEMMWEYWPEVGDITNSTGISMIPVGYAMLNGKSSETVESEFLDHTYPKAQFKGYLSYAAFWTADKVENEEGMAYYRYVIAQQPDLIIGKTSTTSFGASVRCIRKK